MKSIPLYYALSACVVVASCNNASSVRSEAVQPPQVAGPISGHPIEISLAVLKGRVFKETDPIPVLVRISNSSEAPVLACVEDWDLHKGLIQFKVYGPSGDELPIVSEFDHRFRVDEKADLLLLRPGEQRSGMIDLVRRNRRYNFEEGPYFVVAEYFCPFQGSRILDGKQVPVVSAPQRSLPVQINVDYR